MEKRLSPRKQLRIKAKLTISETFPMTVYTVDVGKFGMCVTGMARQLPVGQEVHIAFEMPYGGKVHAIAVHGRVSHCTTAATDGYRVGLQFINLDSDSVGVLAQYSGA